MNDQLDALAYSVKHLKSNSMSAQNPWFQLVLDIRADFGRNHYGLRIRPISGWEWGNSADWFDLHLGPVEINLPINQLSMRWFNCSVSLTIGRWSFRCHPIGNWRKRERRDSSWGSTSWWFGPIWVVRSKE